MNTLEEQLNESVDAFVVEIEAAIKDVQERAQNALKERLKAYFEVYPDVAEIRWAQYTPYFADGDVCEFGVHEVTLHTANDVEYGTASFWECGEDYVAKNGGYSQSYHTPAAKTARKIIYSIPEDTIKTLFGDHVGVIVSRDGVKVEAHDHE